MFSTKEDEKQGALLRDENLIFSQQVSVVSMYLAYLLKTERKCCIISKILSEF